MGVGLDWKAKRSSQAEIGQLDDSVLIDEQVLRLEITVHDSVRVAVGRRLKNLVRETLNLGQGQSSSNMPHVLLQIIVAVFEDEVELVLRVDNFFQLNDVGVLQALQEGDLADGSARNAVVFFLELDFLESDNLRMKQPTLTSPVTVSRALYTIP